MKKKKITQVFERAAKIKSQILFNINLRYLFIFLKLNN
jgi:hypothetical protein